MVGVAKWEVGSCKGLNGIWRCKCSDHKINEISVVGSVLSLEVSGSNKCVVCAGVVCQQLELCL